MTPDTVIDIGQQALLITTMILGLLLMPALAVGLLISLFQAATQINEMTLSFIPKLMVTFLVLALGGPWILDTLLNYMNRII
ncbi:MAG: flagellar biosynthetic protein FliQ [Halothiobacillaceae bacterium]|nr:MAG: flagellar biosynthetic protein FliQ [Halothiobacillaceae bacterium]